MRMQDGIGALRGRACGVTGLGPAGLIAAQMARAGGAPRVVGFDLSADRPRAAVERGGGRRCR